jgi:hypothetical protein
MPMLDIFHSDAFSVTTLTDAINKIKFVPGRLGSLGLFRETGVTTTSVVIEERNGVLVLVSPTPRGGPGDTLPFNPRSARSFMVPHFEINDSVMAEEVQNVRAFGSETEIETVQNKIGEHLEEATNSLGSTQEYARVGAVKGIVTYADGSTLNLYTQFGVTPPTDVDLNLDAASPAAGILRQQLAGIARTIGNELSGTSFSGLYGICGDAFFDALVAHNEVRESYLSWNAAAELRTAVANSPAGAGSWNTFAFGGVMFDNYFGKVGSTTFVDTDACHIFPLGVPNLFRSYYAPADYIETVNTNGRRLYTKQYEMPNGKGIHLDTQMNSLDICTRPGVLVKATRT